MDFETFRENLARDIKETLEARSGSDFEVEHRTAEERAVNYVHDDIGTAKVYAGVSSMVCKSMKVPDFLLRKELDESNWAEEINEDYNRRGKKAARR